MADVLVSLFGKPPSQLGRVDDAGYLGLIRLQNGRHVGVALNLMLFLDDLRRRGFRLRLLVLSSGGREWACFGSIRVELPAQDGSFSQKLVSHVPGQKPVRRNWLLTGFKSRRLLPLS